MKWRATATAGSTTRKYPEHIEREHLQKRLWRSSSACTVKAPRLVHRARQPHTRRLILDEGGFLYDSDYYGDDLPVLDHGEPIAQGAEPY